MVSSPAAPAGLARVGMARISGTSRANTSCNRRSSAKGHDDGRRGYPTAGIAPGRPHTPSPRIRHGGRHLGVASRQRGQQALHQRQLHAADIGFASRLQYLRPLSRLPCTQNCSPAMEPAQGRQRSPVQQAVRPLLSMTAHWRSSMHGSVRRSRSSTSPAGLNSRRKRRPSMPRYGLICAWVATAPHVPPRGSAACPRLAWRWRRRHRSARGAGSGRRWKGHGRALWTGRTLGRRRGANVS